MVEKEKHIYLDHAASAFPKAPGVAQAVSDFLTNVGANPGRSAHRLSMNAARIIYRCREAINSLFSGKNSERVVFTHNVTHAINLVLWTHLKDGDHVITTTAEHNALMRPLNFLSHERNIDITRVKTSPEGDVDPEDIKKALGPKTRLVALMHGSNVTGVVRNLPAIAATCQDIPLLLDCAQTAGSIPISLKETPVDFFCFTGHKGLLGPTGTGGVIIGENIKLTPFICGGTGSKSEGELQPEFLPDSHESGTPNTAGLAGLLAALEWLQKEGVANIRQREEQMRDKLISSLEQYEGIKLFLPKNRGEQLPTISLSVDGHSPSTVGLRLDREASVCVRVGLHCSPSSHQCMGTWPEGTVRLSAGPFTTDEDIECATAALLRIATS